MTVRVAKRPGSGPVAQAGVIGEGGGGHWKQRGKCRECREERADDNTAGQQADYAGKGIFVITGASAAAADSAIVAQFLNPYGNNATYAIGSTHYFVVDVAGQGAALYLFKDDSNGDSNIVGDELSPIVQLMGVNTADLSYINFI